MKSGIITQPEKYWQGWAGGLPETPCGFGSKLSQTEIQRTWMPAMVEKYQISTISDIGAGDLNWIGLIEWPHPVRYSALDLVPRAKSVTPFDIIYEIPPKSDLLVCLWLLNHLPEHHAKAALKNLLASGSKYLMYTWWPAMADFLDLDADDSVIIRSQIEAELRIIKLESTQ
jgi:hypothetical protein